MNAIKRDVFEPLYTKRPSKSSRSSKSSQESYRTADEQPTSQTNHSPFSTNTYRKSKGKNPYLFDHHNAEEKNRRTPISALYSPNDTIRLDKNKPREYIFGSELTSNQSGKTDHEKENINNLNKNDKNDDRFKTVTINSLRRSFRDTFLDSSKPVKGREHQPMWFIDVNDSTRRSSERKAGEKKTSLGSIFDYHPRDDNFNKSTESGPTRRSSATVQRNETFRIDDKPSKVSTIHSSLGRKNTFRVNDEKSRPKFTYFEETDNPSPIYDYSYKRPFESSRVVSPTTDRAGKVGIVAPYSALNDLSGRTSKQSLYSKFNTDRPSSPSVDSTPKPYGHDTVDHPSPRLLSNVANNDVTFINGNDKANYSDLPYDRIKRSELSSPVSTRRGSSPKVDIKNTPNRTIIEIRPREPSPLGLGGSPVPRDPNYLSMGNKYISARQSFRDLNVKPEASNTKTPFRIGSFRSALTRNSDEPGSNYRTTNESNTFSSSFGNTEDGDNDSGPFNKKQWTNQSWRNISTRPFSSEDSSDPNSRSFVPYYKYNADNNDPQPNIHDSKFSSNNNRTTISINFNNHHNSNISPTKELFNPTNSIRTNNDYQYDNDDPSSYRKTTINLSSKPTSSIKIPATREKPNKNRSVNFPSVEYEVRLISPNYDSTKPRRKPSQRSAKATSSPNDWTFNKVHL